MAKLRGPLRLQGTIGDMNFYFNPEGENIARMKPGPSPEMVRNDLQFEGLRRYGKDFGEASKGASLLLRTFHPVLRVVKGRKYYSSLVSLMVEVVHSDRSTMRGKRAAEHGNLSLLEGFNCNPQRTLFSCFTAPFSCSADREEGKFSVDIPPFIPATRVNGPADATHFQLTAAASPVDFPNEKYNTSIVRSEMIPLDHKTTEPLTLETNPEPGGTLPWVLLLGIEFFMAAGNTHIPVKGKGLNAGAIVKIAEP